MKIRAIVDGQLLRLGPAPDTSGAVSAATGPTTLGLETTNLGIIDGRIVDDVTTAETGDGETKPFDASGLIVAPGFVDLQINGGFGIDLVTDPDGIWELGRRLPATGVTAFAPTLISSPPPVIEKFLAVLADRPADYLGAEPLGAHLEGPFINAERAGAHRRDRIRELAELSQAQIIGLARLWARDGLVRLVTLAPELPGALDLIDELTDFGVAVSLGHTTATAAQAGAAIEAGATMVTHLFNAMEPIHHRQPNLAGLALTEPRLVPSLIADGVHVDRAMVAATWNARRPHGLALVTDAIAAMGADPGSHQLGTTDVVSDGSAAKTSSGVLAGSLLSMDRAVSNLMSFADVSLAEAVGAASGHPARLVGELDRGHLGTGAHADVVLLSPNDEGITVKATIVGGRLCYRGSG